MRRHVLVLTAITVAAALVLQGRTTSVKTAFAATNICGTINDGTWTLANSPYVVTCSSSLGSPLTIAPGVVVKFEAGTRLDIGTTLTAEGTVESPIVFTSNKTSPSRGDWAGLHFGANSDSSALRHATVEYGTGVEVNSSSPVIDNAIIRYNSGPGIYLYGSNSTLSYSQITDNQAASGAGIYIVGGSVTVDHCTISRNVADTRGGGIHVNGWGIGAGATATISNNLISHNSVGSYAGGGILFDSANGSITNNTIEDNSAGAGNGGGINISGASRPQVDVRNNTVIRNSASSSAGIATDALTTISGNLIAWNRSSSYAGGLGYSYPFGPFSDRLVSCNTIVGNSGATNRGNGIWSTVDSPFHNNSIYGNSGYQFERDGGLVDATSNYWGTTDASAIAAGISGPLSTSPVLTAPDPCAPAAPTYNVVLFVQGIASKSGCNDDTDSPPANYGETKWLRDYLKGRSDLGLSDSSFLYYDYTSYNDDLQVDESPSQCSTMNPLPSYERRDACYSLDDKYTWVWDRYPEGGGEANRFAVFLHGYLSANPHARVTIVGHSQGGVLAAYALTKPLLWDDSARIRALITLDSPLGGVWGDGAHAYDLAAIFWACRKGPKFDSATDMATDGDLIARLHNSAYPSVPVFTVNASPGLYFGYPVADNEHSQLPSPWQVSHLQVDTFDHGDVWKGPVLGGLPLREAEALEEFVYCAVKGIQPAGDCDDHADAARNKITVLLNDAALHEAPVAEHSATLKVYVGPPNSIVTTTLESPSGRVIDADTSAPDVTHFSGPEGESFEILSPEEGTWMISLFGTDVPPEGEPIALSVMVAPDASADSDGDAVRDEADNCLGLSNPDQSDKDQDGLGDACDPDTDDDGVPNGSDNCPFSANLDQLDSDHNGLGDACDPGGLLDSDSDGVVDNLDNCPFDANPDQANADGDIWGDVCDLVTDAPDAPVGGIAYLPDTTASARATAESSRGSSTPYAPIAGAAAGGALLLVAGGWYARRRWAGRR